MGYRFVFSQMFDVRPRTSAGELDVEKIKKIERFLNLRPGDLGEQLGELDERIIDLKKNSGGFQIPEVKKEQSEKIRKNREVAEKSRYTSWPSFSRDDMAQSLLEISAPNESEILSILEMIEEADQILKKEGRPLQQEEEQKKVYEIPTKSINEVAPAVLPIEIMEKTVPENEYEEAQDSVAENDNFVADAQIMEEYHPGEVITETEDRIEWPGESFSEIPYFVPNKRIADTNFLTRRLVSPKILFKNEIAKSRSIWQNNRKPLIVFLAAACLVFSFIPLLGWTNAILNAKNEAMIKGFSAYDQLLLAKDSIGQADFSGAQKNFENAYNSFASADSQITKAGGWLIFILDKIPGFSYFSSRLHLVKVGQEISRAGQEFSAMIGLFDKNKISFSDPGQNQPPLSDILEQAKERLEAAVGSLVAAKQDLEHVKISSLPQDMQPQLTLFEEKMPQITQTAGAALDWMDKLMEILGHQSAKKYLLIFQNNAEARATGGFIGTYGILDLDQGRIKNLFIDGIFNPDGQLKEKVIPPQPIQKISTAWSMHDSNWFADFPTSAQKLMWFYEKTGGPTTDGVISLTPAVIERLLPLTGPIDLPQYNVSLDENNFFELTEYKVEIDYNKELNEPKKILADFAPIFIDKISRELKNNNLEVLKVISELLKEKHILFYFSQPDLEEFVQAQGWGGEILDSSDDYFSVVNSNINGFKTDRVVKEGMRHSSQITEDGSIIDTLEITRRHEGGASQYEWFNKVNVDYLRVYLPKGSELISATGQTQEKYQPPIDYAQAGFRSDAEVAAIEKTLKIDPQSGTQIFEESGKTVFANWVYVSPGETVTLVYQYRLPFRLDMSKGNANFSLAAQKQSGSAGSQLEINIKWPESWKLDWSSIGNIQDKEINEKTDLSIDRAIGLVFSPQ